MKVIVFLLGVVFGVAGLSLGQSYFYTSYDILIHRDNFLERIELAKRFYEDPREEAFEGHLLCDIAWSGKKLDQYFKINGYESKSIDLAVIDSEYRKSLEEIFSSRGYESSSFFDESCTPTGRLKSTAEES